jgi:hypothetical protein
MCKHDHVTPEAMPKTLKEKADGLTNVKSGVYGGPQACKIALPPPEAMYKSMGGWRMTGDQG